MKGAFIMLTRKQIEQSVRYLLKRYDADYALLFGSYARGEETPESDIDIIVFGGDGFKKTNIFAFAILFSCCFGQFPVSQLAACLDTSPCDVSQQGY